MEKGKKRKRREGRTLTKEGNMDERAKKGDRRRKSVNEKKSRRNRRKKRLGERRERTIRGKMNVEVEQIRKGEKK